MKCSINMNGYDALSFCLFRNLFFNVYVDDDNKKKIKDEKWLMWVMNGWMRECF